MGEQDFAIRRTQRHDLALPARFCVAPEHAGVVKFSAASGARDGWIDGGVVDVSSGGLGLVSPIFVPRRCLVTVRVRAEESDESPTILEVAARVQRIVMTDRRPAYLLGTAYEGMTADTTRALQAFMSRLEHDHAA